MNNRVRFLPEHPDMIVICSDEHLFTFDLSRGGLIAEQVQRELQG
jgi:hypothetical protein